MLKGHNAVSTTRGSRHRQSSWGQPQGQREGCWREPFRHAAPTASLSSWPAHPGTCPWHLHALWGRLQGSHGRGKINGRNIQRYKEQRLLIGLQMKIKWRFKQIFIFPSNKQTAIQHWSRSGKKKRKKKKVTRNGQFWEAMNWSRFDEWITTVLNLWYSNIFVSFKAYQIF